MKKTPTHIGCLAKFLSMKLYINSYKPSPLIASPPRKKEQENLIYLSYVVQSAISQTNRKTPSSSQNAGLALINTLEDECKEDFFKNNVLNHFALFSALNVTTHSKAISPKNLYMSSITVVK